MSSILCSFEFYTFGFWEEHNTQNAFFKLLHSWKEKLNQKWFAGTILRDLSKAYDCMPHDLLRAKLECYGIDKIGLSLILDCDITLGMI